MKYNNTKTIKIIFLVFFLILIGKIQAQLTEPYKKRIDLALRVNSLIKNYNQSKFKAEFALTSENFLPAIGHTRHSILLCTQLYGFNHPYCKRDRNTLALLNEKYRIKKQIEDDLRSNQKRRASSYKNSMIKNFSNYISEYRFENAFAVFEQSISEAEDGIYGNPDMHQFKLDTLKGTIMKLMGANFTAQQNDWVLEYLDLSDLELLTSDTLNNPFKKLLNHLIEKEKPHVIVPLFQRVFELIQLTRSERNLNCGIILNNIGGLLCLAKEYDLAVSFYIESLDILETTELNTRVFKNLIFVYLCENRYEDARKLFYKVKDMPSMELTFCELQIFFDLKSENLSDTKYNLMKFEEIIDAPTRVKDEVYKIVKNHLAILYEQEGNQKEASNSYRSAILYQKEFIKYTLPYLSPIVQQKWVKGLKRDLYMYQSFVFRHPQDSLLEEVLDYQILLNNYLVDSRRSFAKRLKTQDTLSLLMYWEWKNKMSWIAKQKILPDSLRSKNIKWISEGAESIEKRLLEKSKEFSALRKFNHFSDVRINLTGKENLIVFSNFQYRDVSSWTDSIFYTAYLVSPGNNRPIFIPLFTENEFKEKNKFPHSPSFYKSRAIIQSTETIDLSHGLCELIWGAILPLIKNNTKSLYVYPSGLLNKYNLGAIFINDSTRLFDKFNINRLSSISGSITQHENEYGNSAIIYGGLYYNSGDSRNTTKKIEGGEKKYWTYLPKTKVEADKINILLKKRISKIFKKTGLEGTEEFLKKNCESTSPRIIHLATHGYYFPFKESSPNNLELMMQVGYVPYKISEDPLIRSGLILAGADHAWQGHSPLPCQEDGIFTAYEISLLDLTNTELVVLSACETGLGDIDSNEGVYGLQRGFKMAGVKYIIMSLWKVPDHETQELMVLFYKKWLEVGLTIPDAFRAAQGEMREKYEEQPEKWAGFILVE